MGSLLPDGLLKSKRLTKISIYIHQENVALVASRITPSNFVSLSRKLEATRKDVRALLLANAIVVDARMALDLFRLQAQRKALMKSSSDVSESSKMSGKSGSEA